MQVTHKNRERERQRDRDRQTETNGNKINYYGAAVGSNLRLMSSPSDGTKRETPYAMLRCLPTHYSRKKAVVARICYVRKKHPD